MQLREPESFGIFNHHQTGVGYINPDLNHSGRDEYIDVTFADSESGLNSTTIDGDEFTLTGTGVGTVTLTGTPTFSFTALASHPTSLK